MAKQMLLYRGSLKSCNYRCSYCPFSKRRSSEHELARDRSQWIQFYGSLAEGAKEQSPKPGEGVDERAGGGVDERIGARVGAVMITPYGEALIHPWYWKGIAAISSLETIDAVGAQTNLSFDAEEMLDLFDRAGGRRDKLRLWASFHPEMISAGRFSQQCERIVQAGVTLCAGAVGAPHNLDLIRHLREILPGEIYLWINRMDGLRRPYTQAERSAFQDIDPYFPQELKHRKASPANCADRLFAEGDGTLRLCNISRPVNKNRDGSAPVCGHSACSCYLAYGGRRDYEHHLAFGRYPLFRVPWKPRAFFFDIDGTLIPRAAGRTAHPSPALLRKLEILSGDYPLFLATSLPYRDAVKRCHGFSSLFAGGIFAGGAHILLTKDTKRWETYLPLDHKLTDLLKNLMSAPTPLFPFRFRIRFYENEDIVYKATLEKPSKRPWTDDETASVLSLLSGHSFRSALEGSCLQVTSPEADKGAGVRRICSHLGINPKDTLSAGDSPEDISMFSACGFGIASPDSPPKVRRAADLVWMQNSE